MGDLVAVASREGETSLRAQVKRANATRRGLYDVSLSRSSGANVVTTEFSRLGDELSGIQSDGGAGAKDGAGIGMAAGMVGRA